MQTIGDAAWAPTPLLHKVLTQPQAYLGDRPLNVTVIWRDRLGDNETRAAAVEQFAAGGAKIDKFGDCRVLGAQKSALSLFDYVLLQFIVA